MYNHCSGCCVWFGIGFCFIYSFLFSNDCLLQICVHLCRATQSLKQMILKLRIFFKFYKQRAFDHLIIVDDCIIITHLLPIITNYHSPVLYQKHFHIKATFVKPTDFKNCILSMIRSSVLFITLLTGGLCEVCICE